VLKDAAAEELVVAKRSRVVPTLLLALRMKCYWTWWVTHLTTPKTALDWQAASERFCKLVAEGKIIKEIAAVLNVSPRTVEFHKNNIVAKTGLRTTAELARYPARHGLVSESSWNSAKTSWLREGPSEIIGVQIS
jgi:DNA-binding CsgD family transcriptional regulator